MMVTCKQKGWKNQCNCNFSKFFLHVFASNEHFRRSIPEKRTQFLKARKKLYLLIYNN